MNIYFSKFALKFVSQKEVDVDEFFTLAVAIKTWCELT